MDNGSATQQLLEVARLLATNRHLLRGLKSWPSGRGTRMAAMRVPRGSRTNTGATSTAAAWRTCVDSGAVGATVLGETNVMARQATLPPGAFAVVPDEEFTRPLWTRGRPVVPGATVCRRCTSMSQQPGINGCDGGVLCGDDRRQQTFRWPWLVLAFRAADTIDKIDPANLVRDTKVYVLTVLRLCACAVLPLDYRRVCDEMRQSIRAISRAAHGPGIDIGPVLDELDRLQIAWRRLRAGAGAPIVAKRNKPESDAPDLPSTAPPWQAPTTRWPWAGRSFR